MARETTLYGKLAVAMSFFLVMILYNFLQRVVHLRN